MLHSFKSFGKSSMCMQICGFMRDNQFKQVWTENLQVWNYDLIVMFKIIILIKYFFSNILLLLFIFILNFIYSLELL